MAEAKIIQLHPLPGKYNGQTGIMKRRWSSAKAFSGYLLRPSRQKELQLFYALLSMEPGVRGIALHDPG
ncbi:hypothetical protein [Leisingera methylohalidivorans]|uniref:Uncharacterized protein n=1 Tax=Leisingera methylohalidivorans DSM 14336 TaxID=999552 RepID=V9VZ02_9RHOB|nr:hypothetical protein [Leisingera methylohalidivorans]AHD02994.1 hypothetical protein METH_07995 [Leisingera methylohalidivorans DSM 14336]